MKSPLVLKAVKTRKTDKKFKNLVEKLAETNPMISAKSTGKNLAV